MFIPLLNRLLEAKNLVFVFNTFHSVFSKKLMEKKPALLLGLSII